MEKLKESCTNAMSQNIVEVTKKDNMQNEIKVDEKLIKDDENGFIPCKKCQKLFVTVYELDNHITRAHPLCLAEYFQKVYCHFCDVFVMSTERLQQHLQAHRVAGLALERYYTTMQAEKQVSYKCNLCSYETNLKHHLTRHTNNKHSEPNKTNEVTKSIFDKSDRSGKCYKCYLCDYETKQICHLYRPSKSVRVHSDSKIKKNGNKKTNDLQTDEKITTEFEGSNKIDIKEAIIATESTYAIDVKLNVKTSVDLVNCSQLLHSARYCRECQTLFPTSAAMYEHAAHWHPRQVLKSSGKYCFLCHRVYSEKQFLYAHINSAHINSLQCRDCNREFPLQEILDDHVRTVHKKMFERKQFIDIVGKFNNFSKVSIKTNEVFFSNAVFECGKCQMNFSSYGHCRRHYNKCKNDLAGKLCVICRRIFSPSNYTHSIQHKSGFELVTYIVDSTDLKVVVKCPKCGVHYPENFGSFKIHLGICGNIAKNVNFKCCDLQLSTSYFKKAHEGRHDKVNYTVLNYHIYKQ